jgi:hypothetical protein
MSKPICETKKLIRGCFRKNEKSSEYEVRSAKLLNFGFRISDVRLRIYFNPITMTTSTTRQPITKD